MLILLGAAAAAYFFGKGLDVWVILATVLLNAMLGFVLEHRASGAIAALKRMTSPMARVLREGELHEVPAAGAVVGDILVLEARDRVAADARLLRVSDPLVEESGLTGESLPVAKQIRPVAAEVGVALGDRVNMVYMNTAVTHGRGRAIVVATGMAPRSAASRKPSQKRTSPRPSRGASRPSGTSCSASRRSSRRWACRSWFRPSSPLARPGWLAVTL